jgi:hypothetical protein
MDAEANPAGATSASYTHFAKELAQNAIALDATLAGVAKLVNAPA